MNKPERHAERFAVLISLLLSAAFVFSPLTCHGSAEPLRVSVSGSGCQDYGAPGEDEIQIVIEVLM
jgi:hypothetical protein